MGRLLRRFVYALVGGFALVYHKEISDAWDSRRQKWALDYLKRNGEEQHKKEVQSLRKEIATMQIEVGELRGQTNIVFALLKKQGFNLGKGLQCPPPNEHFRPEKRDVSKFG